MKFLQLLDVSGNSIGCVGWNSLREPLAALKHLSQLDISGNLIHHNDLVQSAGRVSPEGVHPNVEEEASGAHFIPESCIAVHFNILCNIQFGAQRRLHMTYLHLLPELLPVRS